MPPFTGSLGFKASKLGSASPGLAAALADKLDTLPHVLRHWRLDEAAGTSLHDDAGTGNLTLQALSGSVAFAGTGPDGSNCVTTPNVAAPSFFQDQVTHAALTEGAYYLWFKPTSSVGSGVVLGQFGPAGYAGPLIQSVYSSDFGLNLYLTFGAASPVRGGFPLTAGSWYEIYAEWSESGGYARLYLNGQLIGTNDNHFSDAAWSANGPYNVCVGGGTQTSFGSFSGCPGSYSNAMVFSQPLGQTIISPPSGFTVSLPLNTGTPSGATEYAVSTGNLRLTDQLVESLETFLPHLLLTDEVVETLRTGNFFLRSTTLAVEVLRSASSFNAISVSATTNFTISATCSEIHGHQLSVSAASSFTLTATATERVGHSLPVSASSGLTLSPSARGYVPAVHNVTARSDMTVSANGSYVVHNPTNYTVSATTSLSLASVASIIDNRSIMVSATTSIVLSSSSYSPRSYVATASTTIFLNGTGLAKLAGVFVDASTAIVLSSSAKKPHTFGPRFVSAGSSIRFSQIATFTNPGPRLVSAATNLSLATTATFTRAAILLVSAVSGISVAGTGSETAVFGVRASSGLVLVGTGRQNRDISASATTSIGMSSDPLTNNLKPVSATDSMTLTVSASVLVTGTEAKSGVVFTDLAQAVVWIPWRRTSLTLPPGGNLPHS